jgi:hypothetical protein
MFNNFDSDSYTEVGHTRSGRAFKEVPLDNLFKKNYGDEGFYSGEEVYLTNEEHLEPARAEEGATKEPHREEPKTSRIVQTIEVSTIIPFVDSTTLRNQSN